MTPNPYAALHCSLDTVKPIHYVVPVSIHRALFVQKRPIRARPYLNASLAVPGLSLSSVDPPFFRCSLRYLLRCPMPSLALKVINITPGPLLLSSFSSFCSATPCLLASLSLHATARVSVLVARITLGSSWLLGR